MLWIKEVEGVNSVYDLKTSCSIQRSTLFLILSCSRKNCFSPEKDFMKFLLQNKDQSEWTKGSESKSSPSWKRGRLLDQRWLSGHWRPWIRTRFFRLVFDYSSKRHIFRRSIRDGMKIYCQWSKSVLIMQNWIGGKRICWNSRSVDTHDK